MLYWLRIKGGAETINHFSRKKGSLSEANNKQITSGCAQHKTGLDTQKVEIIDSVRRAYLNYRVMTIIFGDICLSEATFRDEASLQR